MTKHDESKKLEERLTDMENQLKRAVADYRNLENRILNDAVLAAGQAQAALIKKILPALDSLDQAVEGAMESDTQSVWLKGTLMAIKSLRQSLSDEGLVEIPAIDKFDPRLHEAVDVAEGEEGQVVKIVQRGYTLNDRVVRPAKVIVGKAQPEEISEEAKKEITTEGD
jgi:molecular chaperone GrpE